MQILDDRVVNQIAAGEVVERPVSVVKELVENALDAGAREITVTIANGGQSSIVVLDDGCGMAREDVLIAIQRFGTSKVRAVEDLFALETHGFRGEAIPSIASVSRFEISTAVRGGGGTRLMIEGGMLTDVSEAPLAPGTRIEVRNLFYNVPARRKFLRSETTETGLIRAVMIDFALAYPEVRFRLLVDGAQSAHYAPGGDLFRRSEMLKLAGKLPLQCEERVPTAAGPVVVRAVLSQPIESVASSGRLRLLVNNRSVRDKMLLKAVRDGYGNFLRPGRYPAGVLSLSIPPEDLDVNVHPQKTEVRFRRPEVVFGVVTRAVKHALEARGTALLEAAGVGGPSPEAPSESESEYSVAESGASWGLPESAAASPVTAMGPATLGHFAFHAETRAKRMRYVGQLLRCYLVFEGEERVAILDMHAAHERVMFYRLKTQLTGGAVHSQWLLLPESVPVDAELVQRLPLLQESLERFGFVVEPLGESAIVVRAVPALLAAVAPGPVLLDLLTNVETELNDPHLEQRVDAVIARLACHRSIRSGRELEAPEAYELLEALDSAEASGYCPHGRPVMTFLAEREFEAMFGRV